MYKHYPQLCIHYERSLAHSYSSLTLWVYCKAEYFRSLHSQLYHSLAYKRNVLTIQFSLSSALIANTSLLLCLIILFYTHSCPCRQCVHSWPTLVYVFDSAVKDLATACPLTCYSSGSYWWRRPSTPSRSPQSNVNK